MSVGCNVPTSSVRRLPALQKINSWNTVAAKNPALLDRPESPLPGCSCNQEALRCNCITLYTRHYNPFSVLTVLTSNANVQSAKSVLNSCMNMRDENVAFSSFAALKQQRMELSEAVTRTGRRAACCSGTHRSSCWW